MAATENTRTYFLEKLREHHHAAFIPKDPICIPHLYSKKEDIEIAGFFAAILAWGNRSTIITSCNKILDWMDHTPYQFIKQHQPEDLKPMMHFVHRTFNATDLLYFIEALRMIYRDFQSMENAFVPTNSYEQAQVGAALTQFHETFFSLPHPARTRKHVATPVRNSACKRLCMYLRWMVRQDIHGIDFGIWNKISAAQLVCPLDVHVARVAFRFGLIPNPQANWKNALLLTAELKVWLPEDPTLFDFALFGMGREERF